VLGQEDGAGVIRRDQHRGTADDPGQAAQPGQHAVSVDRIGAPAEPAVQVPGTRRRGEPVLVHRVHRDAGPSQGPDYPKSAVMHDICIKFQHHRWRAGAKFSSTVIWKGIGNLCERMPEPSVSRLPRGSATAGSMVPEEGNFFRNNRMLSSTQSQMPTVANWIKDKQICYS
jgi:hypothetical protein